MEPSRGHGHQQPGRDPRVRLPGRRCIVVRFPSAARSPVPPLLSVEDAVVEVPARGLAPYDIMVLEVPVEVSALVAAPGAQLSFSLGPGATKTGTFEGRRYSDPILSI